MKAQAGVALVTAMLIVAMVTIIGAGMLTRMNLAVHRDGNLWEYQQAWWYALGVQDWVGEILRRDRENNKIDTLDEAWAQPVALLPIEGGGISGRVIDLQGRFNLNNLAGANAANAIKQFTRLIELVGGADSLTALTVAQSARDWVDADQQPTLPNGAEDDYYLGLNPAYRAADRPMADPSELRSVRGMSAKLYSALAPYLTALPATTPVNVNTAPAPVLASLADGIDAAAAKSLVEKRSDHPWQTTAAFLREDELAGLKNIPTEEISVSSSYFQVAGSIHIDRVRMPFAAVLARSASGGTRVIRHSRNLIR